MEHRTEYYVVACRLKQVKSVSGNVLTEEDETGWLGESNDGYAQVRRNRADAKHFASAPSFRTMCGWDGMPWYCQIKSFQIIHVEEIRTDIQITETPL